MKLKDITVKRNTFSVTLNEATCHFEAMLDDGEVVSAPSVDELRKVIADKVQPGEASGRKDKKVILEIPVMKFDRTWDKNPYGRPIRGICRGLHSNGNLLIRWGSQSVEQVRGDVFRNLTDAELGKLTELYSLSEKASDVLTKYRQSLIFVPPSGVKQ